jgi:hypothetical protein
MIFNRGDIDWKKSLKLIESRRGGIVFKSEIYFVYAVVKRMSKYMYNTW